MRFFHFLQIIAALLCLTLFMACDSQGPDGGLPLDQIGPPNQALQTARDEGAFRLLNPAQRFSAEFNAAGLVQSNQSQQWTGDRITFSIEREAPWTGAAAIPPALAARDRFSSKSQGENSQRGLEYQRKAFAEAYDREAAPPPFTDSGLSTTPDWSYTKDTANMSVGYSVSEADVNNDGYHDVIVGTDWYDVTTSDYAAQVFVFHGSDDGPALTPSRELTYSSTEPLWFYLEHLRVASAGDVNGDGFDDVLVGTPWSRDNVNSGLVMEYDGSASGISASPDWTKNDLPGCFGVSLSGAGDVNGDGYSDIIVGACNSCSGFSENYETVYAFYGAETTGLPADPNWSYQVEVAGGEYFGCSVSHAGDVNGDGYDDVIVGASGYSNGQTNEGRAYVFFGSPSGLSASPDWVFESNEEYKFFGSSVNSAGDVNHDGYDDILAGAGGNPQAFLFLGSDEGPSTAPDWTYSDEICTLWSLDTAGDVNGDGYDDILLGDAVPMKQFIDGYAYVFYGSSGLPSASPDWTVSGEGWFAYSVSQAGDVNQDGYGDVIVGAPYYSTAKAAKQFGVGMAYVYLGSCGGCEIDGICYQPYETDPDNICLICDPDQSISEWSYNDQAQCDDGLDCTERDFCSQGVCAGTPNDALCDDQSVCTTDDCEAGTGCVHTDINCDDQNVCTDDLCNPSNGCYHTNNTAGCNDGLYCNGADTCSGGACDQHAGDPCDAQCQTCDEEANSCTNLSGSCDDGLWCNGADNCFDGTCSWHLGGSCDPQCQSCNEGTDQCDNVAGACDDGLFCNGEDTCTGGACDQHAGDPCDAQCQSCNEEMKVCDNLTSACDDGLYCNGADNCSGGACSQHAGTPCPDDELFCNGTESCDETEDECISSGDPCTDNGVFCDGTESCDEDNDECVSSGNPCPDDGLWCNGEETCDEINQDCTVENVPECDNGLFCDGEESCDETADECVSAEAPCDPDTETCNEEEDLCQAIGDDDITDDDTEPPAPEEPDELTIGGGGCGWF